MKKISIMELSEDARKLKNAYAKEWRRKNTDKVKEYQNRYWERKTASVSIENKVLNFHKEGFSLREIASKLNISHMKVSRILKSVTNDI